MAVKESDFPAPSEPVPLNVPRKSARESERPKSADFRIPDSYPLPERSGSAPVKPKRTRALKTSAERSVGEFQLPTIPDVLPEWNKRGGVEMYYAPDGVTKRSDKTYLVYIGLRKLKAWKAQGQDVLNQNILDLVKKARSEKNV